MHSVNKYEYYKSSFIMLRYMSAIFRDNKSASFKNQLPPEKLLFISFFGL
jgi:hypothetical protein